MAGGSDYCLRGGDGNRNWSLQFGIERRYVGDNGFGLHFRPDRNCGGATLLLGEWRYFDPGTPDGWRNLLMLGLGLGGFLIYSGVRLRVKWNKMVLLTVAINVGANLFIKRLMGLGWNIVFVLGWQEMGMWLVNWLMLKKLGQGIVKDKKEILRGLGYGVMQLSGLGMYLKLMQTQPLSMLSVMRRVAIIGASLVVAFVGFGEHKRLGWRQWLGLGLGLLAFAV